MPRKKIPVSGQNSVLKKAVADFLEASDGVSKHSTPSPKPPDGVTTSVAPKIQKQMGKRGWSQTDIDDTIKNPSRTVQTTDTRWNPDGTKNNDPATAYYDADGNYVIRNDRTGDIVQVSDKNDPNWKAPWDE